MVHLEIIAGDFNRNMEKPMVISLYDASIFEVLDDNPIYQISEGDFRKW